MRSCCARRLLVRFRSVCTTPSSRNVDSCASPRQCRAPKSSAWPPRSSGYSRRRCKEIFALSSKLTVEEVATNIRKAARHVNQSEGLIFEKSAPGKRGMELPPLDVPAVDPVEVLGNNFTRDEIEGFPEVSEIEVIRHFTRLSTW